MTVFRTMDIEEIKLFVKGLDENAGDVDSKENNQKGSGQEQENPREHDRLEKINGMPHKSIRPPVHQNGLLSPPDPHPPCIPQGRIAPERARVSTHDHPDPQDQPDRMKKDWNQ